MNHPLLIALFIPVILLNACHGIPTATDRIASANQLAKSAGFIKTIIPTKEFDLVTYQRSFIVANETLVIYIEGDGFAWKSISTPSDNPTPSSPLALLLAIQDTRAAVAYIARPCQFILMPSKGCSETIWTNARYSQMVINSISEAIEKLKKQYHARELILIGYSGGGTIASLITAQRNDVRMLVTVAGNLDPDVWAQTFNLDKLVGSLNPTDRASALSNTKQAHFIGTSDKVIPKLVTQSYVNKLKDLSRLQIIEVKGYGHSCCWQEVWPALLSQIDE